MCKKILSIAIEKHGLIGTPISKSSASSYPTCLLFVLECVLQIGSDLFPSKHSRVKLKSTLNLNVNTIVFFCFGFFNMSQIKFFTILEILHSWKSQADWVQNYEAHHFLILYFFFFLSNLDERIC